MHHALATCLFTLVLVGAGCVKTEEPAGVDSAKAGAGGGYASGGRAGSGGAGGKATSSTGSGGDGSGGAAPGAGGSGGSPPVTSSGGTGGASTGGIDAPIDSPGATIDTSPAPDAGGPADAGSDSKPPGKYWIKTCPAGSSKADCCTFWCECMKTNCPADEPMNCMNTCMGFTNLPCRTYQCFESLNPNVPQDKRSHCGHAIGRGGFGGNCPK